MICPNCKKEMLPSKNRKPERIIAAVAKAMDVGVDAIRGLTKEKLATQARSMAIDLIHQATGLHMKDVGAYFARDRITVHHAIQRSQDRAKVDKDYREKLIKIKKRFS